MFCLLLSLNAIPVVRICHKLWAGCTMDAVSFNGDMTNTSNLI